MIPATIKRGASYRRVLIVREGDASEASVRSVLKTATGVSVQGDDAEEREKMLQEITSVFAVTGKK